LAVNGIPTLSSTAYDSVIFGEIVPSCFQFSSKISCRLTSTLPRLNQRPTTRRDTHITTKHHLLQRHPPPLRIPTHDKQNPKSTSNQQKAQHQCHNDPPTPYPHPAFDAVPTFPIQLTRQTQTARSQSTHSQSPSHELSAPRLSSQTSSSKTPGSGLNCNLVNPASDTALLRSCTSERRTVRLVR
jgi:hypothetical protein